ncbi:putative membrane protein [Yersinia aldovae 670-83]|nr:putative membrane protein [Yersinia aldovae 670-83]
MINNIKDNIRTPFSHAGFIIICLLHGAFYNVLFGFLVGSRVTIELAYLLIFYISLTYVMGFAFL